MRTAMNALLKVAEHSATRRSYVLTANRSLAANFGEKGTLALSPASRFAISQGFALQHRSNPRQRWLLEIVGFWTPDYLARELARYRTACLSNLV
jgi:predicted nuclease of restriction endonuclease-like RecB superfamily